MRLLNTETVELHDFSGRDKPGYAILSHRWGDDEVSFKDVTKRRNLEAAGWTKIRRCCAFVRNLGFEWVWIDTCCIYKSSSAELSEAINSMFKWRDQVQNYYFLEQLEEQFPAWLSGRTLPTLAYGSVAKPIDAETNWDFWHSAWFTRGWTLQELLAPSMVVFLDKTWTIFGSKTTLGEQLTDITGIENVANVVLSHISIATRMSWAAKRACTRPEDLAYCLMGVFEVNMPLLYGEGGVKAFTRLQTEILKESRDESIFAFISDHRGLSRAEDPLAASPACFANCQDIRLFAPTIPRGLYTLTNQGLEVRTVLLPGHVFDSERNSSIQVYFMPLNCARQGARTPLVVTLRKTVLGEYVRYFDRERTLDWPSDTQLEVRGELQVETIYIAGQKAAMSMRRPQRVRDQELEVAQALRASVDKYMAPKPAVETT